MPQLALFDMVLTQVPLHRVSPAAQLATHAPAEQLWPDAHARPHMPQLAPLVWVSTQVPLQRVSPAAQLATQAPATHV
jgi:hypothetical protein